MNNVPTCFVAYPAYTPSLSETIENAIEQINTTRVVNAKSWTKFNVIGKFIIDQVCDAIDSSDIFMCDLTYISDNVLFELGYAIAKNKKIWISLDKSFAEAKQNFTKLQLLNTIGYASYTNSFDLQRAFLEDQPFADLSNTVLKKIYPSIIQAESKAQSLFYLKCEVNTDASTRLSQRLEDTKIPLVTDDPQEIGSQPLAWYAQNTYAAVAVVAHFIDETRERTSRLLQNAKYSFVTGMAYALGKPLIILAHSPYTPPVDYRDLMHVHKTAAECVAFVNTWLPAVEELYTKQLQKVATYEAEVKAAVALQSIQLGEYIAENEHADLVDYFIETAAYNAALQNTQSIIYVGRKGSGKTANLFNIADRLCKNPANHVCIIKPVDYELEGVLRLFSINLSKVERSYFIESLWKFLVYTELTMSVYEEINTRPIYQKRTDDEIDFLHFVDTNIDSIGTEFTVRMEHAIDRLFQVDSSQSIAQQRAKASELLHGNLLSPLRELLGKILQSRQKVCLLVDNLDKAWSRRNDLDVLADFLFGLLNVSQSIFNEFQKRGATWQKVNLSVVVFLRSDIFSYIRTEAREVDKLSFTTMDWNDSRLLQRVIEERFVSSLKDTILPNEVWTNFFIDSVKGEVTKDYIVKRIIPRPRDIIYFCKSALFSAVNHNHTKIEESDILRAEIDYSQHAFYSLLPEIQGRISNFENLLYEFVGSNDILTYDEVVKIIGRANISDDQVDETIEILCDLTFLGLETAPNQFKFLTDESKKKVLQSLARKMAEQSGQRRFAINIAFHSFLEIFPTPSS